MSKKKLKPTALLFVLTLFATVATAQTVNMSKYITLTVTQGEQISLAFRAAAADTKAKVVSGSIETKVTVGTTWTSPQTYPADAGTVTIYGDITGFNCSENGASLTALDVSRNTALTTLFCGANQITALDVSKNTALTRLECNSTQLTALDLTKNIALKELSCYDNQLTTLDVTKNTALTRLSCYGTQLTSLDVSKNVALTRLGCYGNRLTTLDVSRNTALAGLDCSSNRLTALDVSKNTALTTLICYGNNFTTQTFDDLMCSLPIHVAGDNAKFYPLWNADDDANAAATFMAATAQIAMGKSWKVLYAAGGDIPATTGTHVCPTAGIGQVASVATLALYPNPVTDVLHINTDLIGSAITLTDLSGRVVMTATATHSTTTLHTAHLSAGTYMVRVGDKTGKVVKR